MNILITGCAGFIGHALSQQMLRKDYQVLGVDSLSTYYSTTLKELRLGELTKYANFQFLHSDLTTHEFEEKFKNFQPEAVFHLAAQPGVRLTDSQYMKYIDQNILNFIKLCNQIKEMQVPNFVYASSSSVYGNSARLPFSETERFLRPTSFYGSTKLINEVFCENFFNKNFTKHLGLRFFTVYGPFGRPDMSYMRLINSALNNRSFRLYGNGQIKRDFTFINDVVNAIIKLFEKRDNSLFDGINLVNIGGGVPHSVTEMIEIIESVLGMKVPIEFTAPLPQDMRETCASFELLQKLINFKPETDFRKGIESTIHWILDNNLQKKLDEWIKSTP